VLCCLLSASIPPTCLTLTWQSQLRYASDFQPSCLLCSALAGNDLSGTIPASWAEQLPLLERVTVQPGNDDLCAWVPAGAAFQACWQGDVMCWSSSLDSDPANATACGGTGTEQRNSSTFPVAAVAVSVTAAALALVAGLLLLRRRRQRRRQQQLQEGWQKQGAVPPPAQPSDDSQLTQQPSAPIDKPPSGGLAAEPSFAQQLRPSSRVQSQHTLTAAVSAETATAAALAAAAAGAVAAAAASSGMQSTPDTFRFSFRTSKSMDARAVSCLCAAGARHRGPLAGPGVQLHSLLPSALLLLCFCHIAKCISWAMRSPLVHHLTVCVCCSCVCCGAAGGAGTC
jgi:hypothetical protein